MKHTIIDVAHLPPPGGGLGTLCGAKWYGTDEVHHWVTTHGEKINCKVCLLLQLAQEYCEDE